MTVTTRLGLSQPAGTDALSSGDNIISADNLILDNAVLTFEGLFSARGTAASRGSGNFYWATDAKTLHRSDGTNWFDVSPSPGASPIGAMHYWPGSSDPADTRWVKADGRALSTTTYATLFALIGSAWNTAFGASDPGAGLFRIPQTNGRVILGAGASTGLTTRSLGQNGGEETHVLTASEAPAHSHVVRNYHSNDPSGGTPTTQWNVSTGLGTAFNYLNTGTTDTQGSGTAHNNMPPYVVLNQIIRIL